MNTLEKPATVMRVKEWGGLDATVLDNGLARVMIDDWGAMTPELSFTRGAGRLNSHWVPWFRSFTARAGAEGPSNDGSDFWKGELLSHVAGNFPCVPTFGPGLQDAGVSMPAHGWTANCLWTYVRGGRGPSGEAFAVSRLGAEDSAMPLSFLKIDALFPGEPVHYVSLRVKNEGETGLEICAGWHNTVGPPFLEEGCRISAVADAWAVAPRGGEFDATGRLVPGAAFPSLKAAPRRGGGFVDASRVPGPVGYTDLVTGRIAGDVRLGWAAVVNPRLKAAYVSFFPGPGLQAEDDIVLRFTNLWMQYGGRRFTPWAAYEGGTDLTYCLGEENAVAAFAEGLAYSRKAGTVLGAPATFTVPAGKEKVLRYGTLFAPYEGAGLDGGILSLAAEKNGFAALGKEGYWRFRADTSFACLKNLETFFLKG